MITKKVNIILATFNPDLSFFKKQIDSIVAQEYANWKCLITDDQSKNSIVKEIKEIIAKDNRFVFIQSKSRKGVFHNFEFGLTKIDDDAAYIMYCDQDDIWKVNKISKSVKELEDNPNCKLVHTDLELINQNDELIQSSCFKYEKRDSTLFSIENLVTKNSITGCTVCFKRELLPYILPFPVQDARPQYHHDLWTAMHAASYEIRFIDEPLIKYRQHQGNVIGAIGASWKSQFQKTKSIDEWKLRKKIIHDFMKSNRNVSFKYRIDRWVRNRPINAYMIGFCFKLIFSKNQNLVYGLKLIIGKFFEFNSWLFKKFYKPLKFLKLALVTIYYLIKNRNFRFELQLSNTKIIKRNLDLLAGMNFSEYTYNIDLYNSKSFPLLIDNNEKRKINLVLPNLKQEHIFGGAATAIKLGIALVKLGYNVNFISSDMEVSDMEITETLNLFRNRFGASADDIKQITISDGSSLTDKKIPSNENDIFIATFWTTAFFIENTIAKYNLKNERFIYLIQDFEPGFYKWSDEYALAESTYRMNYIGIYNTSLLADFFKIRNYKSINYDLVLQPEIDWQRYKPAKPEEIKNKVKRRILVYGRPNTGRNLFKTIVSSLRLWIKRNGHLEDTLEVLSAGEKHPSLDLGNNIRMESIGKVTMDEYAKILTNSDIGLSLMLSPHPSYPPFDMAASGMIVITNKFENKNLEVSENILSCNPSINEIVNQLEIAWCSVDDFESRIRGSKLNVSFLGKPIDEVAKSLTTEIIK